MTVEELVQRLAAIGAYSVLQKGRISVQVERNGHSLRDGWFNGPPSDIESTLAKAEARAGVTDPGDAEYLSWGSEPYRFVKHIPANQIAYVET
jgi:hypothetical protein